MNMPRFLIKLKNKFLRRKLAKETESKVKANGEQILKKQDELRNLFLEYDRKKMDAKEIKIKIEMLNWVINGE